MTRPESSPWMVRGLPSITLGIASANIPSTISGGRIIIDSFSKTEKSDDFPSWSYKGKHYPGAS